MALMETFYLSHGAPTLAIDETAPASQFFKSSQQSVYKEKPSSILVISVHWETEPTVSVVDRNDTIHDFPKPLYQKGAGTIDLEPCLTHTSAVEPALAPVAVEQTMITCAAASNALWQQRFVHVVTIQCNLCNEPWIKYSIIIVADRV
ncbi:PREDICTED: extradiol ring-cleavage dioxygenase-like isoform X3 [Populus euphratica]|uniref:Extradiol ring-cleavage dioxygenase-like isoform X3 n=1 Tax=Populus euphratica TaxID=75702 RepID=A0AAJ6SW36_POPEU|nr:PREDICTED: extradiol ring-cleavage dioxygenase-like isoform X3 [Populus euphratica]XP_010999707.1 PREDICTED: extradiol ring-cleavage dioxygenase-like isoform X3 [Populus euphratica]